MTASTAVTATSPPINPQTNVGQLLLQVSGSDAFTKRSSDGSDGPDPIVKKDYQYDIC